MRTRGVTVLEQPCHLEIKLGLRVHQPHTCSSIIGELSQPTKQPENVACKTL